MFFSIFISILLWFTFILAYPSLPLTSTEFYWIWENLLSRAHFWLLALLVPITANLTDMTILFFQKTMYPSAVDILREVEWLWRRGGRRTKRNNGKLEVLKSHTFSDDTLSADVLRAVDLHSAHKDKSVLTSNASLTEMVSVQASNTLLSMNPLSPTVSSSSPMNFSNDTDSKRNSNSHNTMTTASRPKMTQLGLNLEKDTLLIERLMHLKSILQGDQSALRKQQTKRQERIGQAENIDKVCPVSSLSLSSWFSL
jgi:hypothetical protein